MSAARAECTRDDQCRAGRRCVAGACAWVECTVDTACPANQICVHGRCARPPAGTANQPPPRAPTSANPLPPPDTPARTRLRNALVPFKGKVVRFSDGIAKDPADARALLQLGQVMSHEMGAAPGPELAAVIHAAGYAGGNNWQAVVAVWTGQTVLRSVGELVVHDMQGTIERIEVADGQIAVHLSRMGPDDPRCCPSEHAVCRLVVRDGLLTPAPKETGVMCDPQGRCALR